MKLRKFVSLLALSALIAGSAMAATGCFEEEYHGYPGYGYGAYYPYGGPPAVYGDWDEHHVWRDRDWWMENHRPWVEEHHREWIARPQPHEFFGHHERHEHD